MNTRHITRFTYKFTNFQGWRVAITRQGVALARYFSDKQYGDPETAHAQAIRFRDMVLDELAREPERTQEILMKHRVEPRKLLYPAGLKPATGTTNDESSTSACSMRSNKVLHGILRSICRRLQLDTASVLKLSLYLFSLQYGVPNSVAAEQQTDRELLAEVAQPEDDAAHHLQSLINELEVRAKEAGLPCFEEFATGRHVTHNTSPPTDEVAEPAPKAPQPTGAELPLPRQHQPGELYMRSPRPSPPEAVPDSAPAATPSPSATSSPYAITTPIEATSAHPPHARDHALPYTLATADTHATVRKRRSNIRTGDTSTPSDVI